MNSGRNMNPKPGFGFMIRPEFMGISSRKE
jgi:hypothetical protein